MRRQVSGVSGRSLEEKAQLMPVEAGERAELT